MTNYAVTALLSYDGQILFPVRSEIEDIARAEGQDVESICREPIRIGNGKISLVWSPQYQAWVRIFRVKEKGIHDPSEGDKL